MRFRLLVDVITMWAVSSTAFAAERRLDLREIEGDYKVPGQSEMVGGPKYKTTNELQIVRHGDKSAFVSVYLEFLNGHECYLSGIAAWQNGMLVYRKPAQQGSSCRLIVKVNRREIGFEDVGSGCQSMTCGARGFYDGATFPLSRRRPVHDAAALRRSDEFRQAVTTFEALPADTLERRPGATAR